MVTGVLAALPRQISMNIIQMTPEITKIPTGAPTKKEIKAAIKHLKPNKASGLDNLPAEFFTTYPNTIADIVESLLKKEWESGRIPNDWKHGLIINLPKKDDLMECSNWRGLTLLNIIGKILATVIHNGLKEELEPKMRPEQASFRSNSVCVDHISMLRIIVEQSIEFCSPLQLVFIDFQRQFGRP